MIVARFKLMTCCLNCRRISDRAIDVPEGDDAPRDVEEFMESALLQSQRFFCPQCESSIATIVGVKRVELEEAT